MKRNCNVCGQVYHAEPRYVNRGQGLTCGRECGVKYASRLRSERAAQKRTPNVECALCSKPFYKGLKHQKNSKSGLFFCSKEHQSEGFRRGLVTPGPTSSKPRCLDCNNICRPTDGRCRKCYDEWRIKEWLSGNNEITIGGGVNKDTMKFVKKYLIETRGDKCEQCGFDEKAPDGRSIIQMDHIDGNCMNNLIDNLRLLCPNHHAMTPNYGSLNKGSGRAWRRKQ